MKFCSLLVVFSALLITGCNTTQETPSGYLPNYSNLETIKDKDGSYHQRWVAHALTRKVSPVIPRSFYIKPIIYYPKLQHSEQLSVEVAAKLSHYINQQITNTFSKHFNVVDTIEPGTLVVEPAITAVRISPEDLSPLEVIPFRAVIASINYAAGGRDQDVEIRLETKVVNPRNNRILAMTVHGGHGIQLENETEKLTQKHITDLVKSWTSEWDVALGEYKNNIKN